MKTIYPRKNIRSVDIGDFRIILARHQYERGTVPMYDVIVWDDFTCALRSQDIDERDANLLYDRVVDTYTVEMAKRAFALS